MAKDDRRKTFAAKESKNSDTNHDDDRPGRRQTTGLPIHKRTNNNASRQSLRVEGIRDELKPKLPKLRGHHEAIQGTFSTYDNLSANLFQPNYMLTRGSWLPTSNTTCPRPIPSYTRR